MHSYLLVNLKEGDSISLSMHSLCGRRLPNKEAEDLTYIFEKFWEAERREKHAAASHLTAEGPSVATSTSPSRATADSNIADEQLSQATANEATEGEAASSKAASPQAPSQQGSEGAADVAGGTNNRKVASKGMKQIPRVFLTGHVSSVTQRVLVSYLTCIHS